MKAETASERTFELGTVILRPAIPGTMGSPPNARRVVVKYPMLFTMPLFSPISTVPPIENGFLAIMYIRLMKLELIGLRERDD